MAPALIREQRPYGFAHGTGMAPREPPQNLKIDIAVGTEKHFSQKPLVH
jgi:hypothetical protein